mmetsp:Transcript_126025/g.362479  ORF Transcript_126025/g.362479 Transcript_126025/m.362479 type:complete len:88 (+) Transcript_126025:997-1260(+)
MSAASSSTRARRAKAPNLVDGRPSLQDFSLRQRDGEAALGADPRRLASRIECGSPSAPQARRMQERTLDEPMLACVALRVCLCTGPS